MNIDIMGGGGITGEAPTTTPTQTDEECERLEAEGDLTEELLGS